MKQVVVFAGEHYRDWLMHEDCTERVPYPNRQGMALCNKMHIQSGWVCTRPAKHAGQHIAHRVTNYDTGANIILQQWAAS